jgi:CRISPR-associated protein Csy1
MQIQAVTHSLKAIHPDARGTNLYVKPSDLHKHDLLGTHALGNHFVTDVVGNAAALDVYKLLRLEVGGRTLLQALTANDNEALQALDDDPAQAQSLREALISLTSEREVGIASHARAKQLYWLVGDDAEDDAHYHLIAPLYATSLAHVVHQEVQEARFGEANKLARHAWREGLPHDGVYREYRDLAVLKLGGTKPQNISQLNSERGGINYLLSSLPPEWQIRRSVLPFNAKSIFDRTFGARPAVRAAIRALQRVLLSERPKNLDIRDRRNELLDRIINELNTYAEELLHQRPGWTRDPLFDDLVEEEKLWLDPLRADLPEEDDFNSRWNFMDWPARVGERFGKWLNGRLEEKLPELGFVESREWRKMLLGSGTWRQYLRRAREEIGSPHYIPTSKTHEELTILRAGK